MNWQPIETAPKDGRPVWVRGLNWGVVDGSRGWHHCYAWHNGEAWVEATVTGETELTHLTHWAHHDHT